VVISFAEWHRHNRNVEIATNDACNVAYWNCIVADGVPDELLARPEIQRAYLGV